MLTHCLTFYRSKQSSGKGVWRAVIPMALWLGCNSIECASNPSDNAYYVPKIAACSAAGRTRVAWGSHETSGPLFLWTIQKLLGQKHVSIRDRPFENLFKITFNDIFLKGLLGVIVNTKLFDYNERIHKTIN